MVIVPVSSNIYSSAQPDVGMAIYISNKFFQRGGTSGAANQPAVQTYT